MFSGGISFFENGSGWFFLFALATRPLLAMDPMDRPWARRTVR